MLTNKHIDLPTSRSTENDTAFDTLTRYRCAAGNDELAVLDDYTSIR